MAVITVNGSDQLAKLARELESLEETARTEALAAGLKAAKAIEPAARKSAMELLPGRNGLAAQVAASTFTTRSDRFGFNVRATNQRAIHLMNRKGQVRHPVYGNREEWVTQRIRIGFWDNAVRSVQGSVERAVRDAVERAVRKVGR